MNIAETGLPCSPFDYTDRAEAALSNEALADLAGDYWTIGSTTVSIVCIASTAGACTAAVMVVAGGNIAISAHDNIIAPMNAGEDACVGLFFTEAAVNAIGSTGSSAAASELAEFTDLVVIANGANSIAQYVASTPSCG